MEDETPSGVITDEQTEQALEAFAALTPLGRRFLFGLDEALKDYDDYNGPHGLDLGKIVGNTPSKLRVYFGRLPALYCYIHKDIWCEIALDVLYEKGERDLDRYRPAFVSVDIFDAFMVDEQSPFKEACAEAMGRYLIILRELPFTMWRTLQDLYSLARLERRGMLDATFDPAPGVKKLLGGRAREAIRKLNPKIKRERGRPVKLTDGKVRRAVRACGQPLRVQQVAIELGVSERTLSTWARDKGFKRTKDALQAYYKPQ